MAASIDLGMNPTTFPNPLGIHGFGFVEFAAPDPQMLHRLFKSMGFAAVARHRRQAITLYRQGNVNFLVNETPDSFAAEFAAAHGACACGFAIRVRDGEAVSRETIARRRGTHRPQSRDARCAISSD